MIFLTGTFLRENIVIQYQPDIHIVKELKYLFYCKSNEIFINVAYVCDGKRDCLMNEDELNCSMIIRENFICQNGNQTINFYNVCNFIKDCEDGSDEEFCC